MTVRLLDEKTILRIAAGEVIERPASVLKEAVENSLDAGAKRIEVFLQDGGISHLEIRDDGSGIEADDLPRVILRHATSKISAPEDLDRISTYGFRGEALAAIAEAADLEILSRVAGKDGRRLAEENGTWRVAPAAMAPGTILLVRRLFTRAPARRKFLSTPRGEAMRCLRILERTALACPQVAWRVVSEGEEVFRTTGAGPEEAAAGVFGREKAESLLEVEAVLSAMTITGRVSPPEETGKTRGAFYFCVNGRPVDSPALFSAVRSAFETLLPPGRHPVGFLSIEIPPGDVDVNCHPTKREIRFRAPNEVFRCVAQAVRTRLRGHRAVPLLYPEADEGAAPPYAETAETLGDDLIVRETPALDAPRPAPDSHMSAQAPLPSAPPSFRLEGRIAGRYLVAEDEEGLVLIDLHAAHERVLFDRLLAESEDRTAAAAPFLLPLPVEVSPAAREAALSASADFARLGFEIESFGPGGLLLRSVPAALSGRGDPVRLVAGIAEELAEDPHRGTKPPYESIARRACHRAVRTGDPMSPEEARDLITDLFQARDPLRCPHGRPTLLRIPIEELDRRFGRS